jgi:cytosine/adenosine deaminase-related metal-dependent hydrolase
MVAHVAQWVLPVSQPPIREGSVLVHEGRIVAVGPAAQLLRGFSGPVRDHGPGAMVPGLVNCHAHLEFSALAGIIPPQARWQDWLDAALAGYGSLTTEEVKAGVVRGIEAMHHSGTALAGEVSNTGISWPFLENSPLAYHLFFECLGFDLLNSVDLEEIFSFFAQAEVADNPRVSAGAHAPYSVSAPLFQAIGVWSRVRKRPQTVHLAESRLELEFLATGDGFFRDLLKRRRRWVEDFQPPEMTPADYLDSVGFLHDATLAVHGVWLSTEDLARLRRAGAWLVLCPRANRYTGAGTPPVEKALEAGVKLALGTDSLAGNWDLNLFGEMLWLYRHHPAAPRDLWLRLGSLNGARALGREKEFGSLEPGKRAALGFIPLSGKGDFWGELYAVGAQGGFEWLG